MLGQNLRKRPKSTLIDSSFNKAIYTNEELSDIQQMQEILLNEGFLSDFEASQIEGQNDQDKDAEIYIESDLDEETMNALDMKATQMLQDLEQSQSIERKPPADAVPPMPDIKPIPPPSNCSALLAAQRQNSDFPTQVFQSFQKPNPNNLIVELKQKNKQLEQELLTKQGEITFSRNRIYQLNDLTIELKNKIHEKEVAIQSASAPGLDKVKRLESTLAFKEQEILQLQRKLTKAEANSKVNSSSETNTQNQPPMLDKKVRVRSASFINDETDSFNGQNKKLKRFPDKSDFVAMRHSFPISPPETVCLPKEYASTFTNTDALPVATTSDAQMEKVVESCALLNTLETAFIKNTTNSPQMQERFNFDAFAKDLIIASSTQTLSVLQDMVYNQLESGIGGSSEALMYDYLWFSRYCLKNKSIHDQSSSPNTEKVSAKLLDYAYKLDGKNEQERRLQQQIYQFLVDGETKLTPLAQKDLKIRNLNDLEYVSTLSLYSTFSNDQWLTAFTQTFNFLQTETDVINKIRVVTFIHDHLKNFIAHVSSSNLQQLILLYHESSTWGSQHHRQTIKLLLLQILYVVYTEIDELVGIEFEAYTKFVVTLSKDSVSQDSGTMVMELAGKILSYFD